MKIKVSRTRILVSLSPREYELLSETVYYAGSVLEASTPTTASKKNWKTLTDFCARFWTADSKPVTNLRGKK